METLLTHNLTEADKDQDQGDNRPKNKPDIAVYFGGVFNLFFFSFFKGPLCKIYTVEIEEGGVAIFHEQHL